MPVEIHCIRHGVTKYNIESRFNGWTDEPITQQQRNSLENCALDTSSYDVVYCSPSRRCIETAVALGIENWIEEPRITERNLGVFEGHTPDKCESLFNDDFRRFRELDADYVIPQGESRHKNLERVLSWLDDLNSEEKVLAITHGGPIDFIYRIASGIPMHGGSVVYASSNASLSAFILSNGIWSVSEYSRHLT